MCLQREVSVGSRSVTVGGMNLTCGIFAGLGELFFSFKHLLDNT